MREPGPLSFAAGAPWLAVLALLGLGNALYVNAYRLSSLIPGSLALILADHLPWSMVYALVALFMVALQSGDPSR